MQKYQRVYSARYCGSSYAPCRVEGWNPRSNDPQRCHYPWCGATAAIKSALPLMSSFDVAPNNRQGPTIKRTFWDCGNHRGGQEAMAACCMDLLHKYDHDKMVRGATGSMHYSNIIKSRVVMCSDVSESTPQCPSAVAWFVVQWCEPCLGMVHTYALPKHGGGGFRTSGACSPNR